MTYRMLQLLPFLSHVETDTIENTVLSLETLLKARNPTAPEEEAAILLQQLEYKRKKLHPGLCPKLAVALSMAGWLFPDKKGNIFVWNDGALLIRQLVLNIPNPAQRVTTVQEIIALGKPLSFVHTCLMTILNSNDKQVSWAELQGMWYSENGDKASSLLHEDKSHEIRVALARRIRSEIHNPSFFDTPRYQTSSLLSEMSEWGNHEENQKTFSDLFRSHADKAVSVLHCYFPPALLLTEENEYEYLTNLVDADLLFDTLHKGYASVMDTPEEGTCANTDIDRQYTDEAVISQFARLYRSHHQEGTENAT